MQTTFLALCERASYNELMRTKRQMLHLTVSHVDQSSLKTTAFSALALHRVQEVEKLGYLKLQLMLNSMQRVFDSFKFYRCFKKSLRERRDILISKRAECQQRSVLLVWARAMGVELRTKMIERAREFSLKQISVAALQRNKNIKQMVKLNQTRRLAQYRELSFKAIQNHGLQKKRLRIIEQ
jgi:hypothetical protein